MTLLGPQSPPKLVRPFQEVETFDRYVSDKIHKNLVTKKHSSKGQPEIMARSHHTMSDSKMPICPLIANDVIVAAMNAKTGDSFPIVVTTAPAIPREANGDATIVSGTREKRRILEAYETKFGTGYPDSIVTRKKGKLIATSSSLSLSTRRMRPSKDKFYRVDILELHSVIATIIKEFRVDFTAQDICNLCLVCKDFASLVPKITRWLKVDFTPLREPRYNYEQQERIDPHRVEMASAAMVHFGLDPGKFVRWMGGEYTGYYRDVKATLLAVRPYITAEDYNHIERILLDGCPAELKFTEPLSNKLEMIRRGNSKSFNDHPELVKKAMNKEDRYSHLVPIDEDICRVSAYLRHTIQTVVMKPGKNDRLVWDGTTTLLALDIVMNQVTPVNREAPITFGHVKIQLYIDIYNTRISHPYVIILLGLADIKACFRFPRIHPDLTGAFGFMAGGFYNLATAMVFGSTTSASSWEPFRRGIEALSVAYADRLDLVIKHKYYLDMISWAEEDQTTKVTPAFPCAINTGTMDASLPARIYVDDALLLGISRRQMELRLAALIEAIFVIMGTPDTTVRQCPLALDKWLDLIVASRQRMLGLIVDTNSMTVGIPPDYVAEVFDLLNTTWHSHRRRFTVGEAQRLTGKLGHLAEGANWVFHLLTHLYASIAYALSENKRLLSDMSPEFRNICLSLKTGSFPCSVKDQVKHINFAMKRAAHLVHHAKFQYNINKTMRQEIEFFREKLLPESGIAWETPIAHIIPRTPTFTSFGDSCLEGAGGYCISLGFWWHIPFPEAVIQRTLKRKKDNKDGLLISINVLEFVTVVVNYCAALHCVTTTSATDDPYPVLLNVTDNASALSWTTGACKKSKVGRLLARFFCSLMINSPLGINSKWISTDDNKIADDISRIKRESATEDSPPFFDYSTLTQTYPELIHCSSFKIQPELISLIWEIVLTERWPCHDEIRRLRLKPLGKLITSSGI